MLVKTQIGTKEMKIIYDQGAGDQAAHSSTQADKELNLRLYSVFQSLDTNSLANKDPARKKAHNASSVDRSM